MDLHEHYDSFIMYKKNHLLIQKEYDFSQKKKNSKLKKNYQKCNKNVSTHFKYLHIMKV